MLRAKGTQTAWAPSFHRAASSSVQSGELDADANSAGPDPPDAVVGQRPGEGQMDVGVVLRVDERAARAGQRHPQQDADEAKDRAPIAGSTVVTPIGESA